MRFELYRHTVGTKKDNQTAIHSFATSHIAILNYLKEASTTLSYRYKLAERSRSQYSHQSFRIAIKPEWSRLSEACSLLFSFLS